MKIKDIRIPELDIFTEYSENQLAHIFEPREGLFIAESMKVFERALALGYEPYCALIEDRMAEEFKRNLAGKADIPVFEASFEELKMLTGYHLTGGVLCAMKRKKLPTVEDIIENKRRIALLEDVVNPTNVGAIFRNAAALGFEGVLLSPGCCDPLYKRALRVSMGTVFQIPWTFINKDYWPFEAMNLLKREGFATVAMALEDDSVSIGDERIRGENKLVALLGSEGYGLTKETLGLCDYTVMIPMSNGVDSLNVAAASALAFYELAQCPANNGSK